VGETDAELAVRAAAAGSEVARSLYGRRLERFAKSVNDFATEADVAAERAIMDILRNARPDDGLVGEELGTSAEATGGRTWLVDPLCGTLNYAARTPLVAVNVALRVDDGITAAAVADPFSAEVFWTDGETARVRSDGRDEPLVPDRDSRLVDLNLDPPSPTRTGSAPCACCGTRRSSTGFTRECSPRLLPWPGWQPVDTRHTSPTGTCATACTSAAESRCARRLDVW
jgi:myo-inositol-1(or 4)-monophosphatase